MYGVDRLKVVMPLECVEIVDKSVFICKVQGKQLLNMMYKRMIPSLLDGKGARVRPSRAGGSRPAIFFSV